MELQVKKVAFATFVVLCGLIGLPQETKTLYQRTPLATRIDKLITDSRIKPSDIGIAIYSVANGGLLYMKNADKDFTIASNAKLFTTACALGKLAPSFTFSTLVYYSGIIYQNVLKGDLIIVGGGDPNVSARFHNGNPTAIFEDWASKLKSLGVKKIDGNIILDDTIFDREYIQPDWEKQDISKWYVAPIGALSLNDNCVDVTIIAARKAGERAEIYVSPDTAYVAVRNNTLTVAKSPKTEIGFSRKKDTNEITIFGDTPVGAKSTFSIAINDPTLFFGVVFSETMRKSGIAVSGTIAKGRLPNMGVSLLVGFKSDLLSTITVANKVSQNFYAEMLLKYLGYRFMGTGTTANGIRVLNDFLSSIYIIDSNLEDGCGLSRRTVASPNDIVVLLKYMANSKYSSDFISTLPVSGDSEGSLKNRMKSKDVKGKVFAKTGHINGVSALSGYVNTARGDTIIFSILINDRHSGAGNPLQDKICELLASM